jgi:hypothetical protein
MLAWSKMFENVDNRTVAKTEVAAGIVVSTVFLGLDHQIGEGPPLLFETMVFNDYGDDGQQYRYSTWDEAEAGHKKTVAICKARLRKEKTLVEGLQKIDGSGEIPLDTGK